MQILVVEDDVRLAQALGHILEENGYGVDVVHDGATGRDWAASGLYDVIVLDVMLPKMDGFSVVAELRRAGVSTPVLLLTARDAVPDKITGLDSGADDYMTKPFSPAELLAHLRALTRRQGEVVFEALSAGDLSLNLESFDLTCGAKSIHLSFKEFSLARVLMANPGQVVSKDLLIEKVWGIESSAEDNNVEAYVSFLRKKLAFLGSACRIETLRKAGYRFAVNASVAGVAFGGPNATSTSENARGNAATGDTAGDTAGVPDIAAGTGLAEDARGSAPC
ncbi:DNA-binding response regulator [Gordonibacter sp. 28C]|uniref:response regulator transcription factor n=1 Tax=Gordonibacter sp. 28C TaxID=2078569 RepID=UPI000DF7E7C4|nr:response regulator transcription factor [Gordonibacter sp. 28C]RDB61392.1 DNA-binding response regulator [Gordonibacter sp. 28C]